MNKTISVVTVFLAMAALCSVQAQVYQPSGYYQQATICPPRSAPIQMTGVYYAGSYVPQFAANQACGCQFVSGSGQLMSVNPTAQRIAGFLPTTAGYSNRLVSGDYYTAQWPCQFGLQPNRSNYGAAGTVNPITAGNYPPVESPATTAAANKTARQIQANTAAGPETQARIDKKIPAAGGGLSTTADEAANKTDAKTGHSILEKSDNSKDK